MKKMFGAQDGQTIPAFSSVDGQQFDSISRGRAHEVDLAVKAATRALEGAWGRLNATERGRVMIRIGQKVLENLDELSKLEAKDTGKPISNARNDVTILARYFEFYGGAADKIHGQIIPFLNDHSVSVIREPHGVTGHIIPWNYPAQMLGRTLAPALAMGNAAVLKPAEDTSMSALRFAEIATDAGLPGGALNVVTGLGEEAGAALTAHAGINFLTFTGSNEVGAHVQEAAARNAVKCVLELGGKSPQIVFDDADLDRALPIIVRAIVQNAGQTCTAGSRLLVQRKIYDEFVGRVANSFRSLRVGTPDMDLDCGPVMNSVQLDRVNRYIDEAKRDGITLLAEGEIAAGVPKGGFYVSSDPYRGRTRSHLKRHLDPYLRHCPLMTRRTRFLWPMALIMVCLPLYGQRTEVVSSVFQKQCDAGRFSSIATEQVAGLNFLSEESKRAVTDAKKGSWL